MRFLYTIQSRIGLNFFAPSGCVWVAKCLPVSLSRFSIVVRSPAVLGFGAFGADSSNVLMISVLKSVCDLHLTFWPYFLYSM